MDYHLLTKKCDGMCDSCECPPARSETPSDWWWNSEPQPLRDALEEAAETRAAGWVVAVLPEGQNPRPDGRWDNP